MSSVTSRASVGPSGAPVGSVPSSGAAASAGAKVSPPSGAASAQAPGITAWRARHASSRMLRIRYFLCFMFILLSPLEKRTAASSVRPWD